MFQVPYISALDSKLCEFFQYSFFHDWNVYDCKNLDLHQKWPRPGEKALEKFTKQNQVASYGIKPF